MIHKGVILKNESSYQCSSVLSVVVTYYMLLKNLLCVLSALCG